MIDYFIKKLYFGFGSKPVPIEKSTDFTIKGLGDSFDFMDETPIFKNATLISIINKIHSDVLKAQISCPSKKIKRALEKPDNLSDYSSFIYKIIQDFFIKGNAIVLIKKQRNYFGFENIDPELISINTTQLGPLYLNRQTNKSFPHSKIIHLRKNSGSHNNYFSGTDLTTYLKDEILNLKTFNQSISNHLKYSTPVVGIIKGTQYVSGLNQDKTVKPIIDNLNVSSGTPLIKLPLGYEFVDVREKAQILKMKADLNNVLEQKIFSFFNISQNVINGSASEIENKNYYNNLLDPFLKYLSQTFSKKLATTIEWKSLPILDYKKLYELGIITLNEYRNEIGYKRYDSKNADKLYRDLNHVDIDLIDEYQTNRKQDKKIPSPNEKK